MIQSNYSASAWLIHSYLQSTSKHIGGLYVYRPKVLTAIKKANYFHLCTAICLRCPQNVLTILLIIRTLIILASHKNEKFGVLLLLLLLLLMRANRPLHTWLALPKDYRRAGCDNATYRVPPAKSAAVAARARTIWTRRLGHRRKWHPTGSFGLSLGCDGW